MPRRQQMCPNEGCEKHAQPTGLMGGCDCGTPLVPYKSLDDQVNEALWDLMSPSMRRLVTYAILAQESER